MSGRRYKYYYYNGDTAGYELLEEEDLKAAKAALDAMLQFAKRGNATIARDNSETEYIRMWHPGNTSDHSLYENPIILDDGFYSDWEELTR